MCIRDRDNIGLEKQDRNIPAYQIMSDVLDRLDIHSGTVFNYHQERRDVYKRQEVDRDKKPFTIVMPPPNITGKLHMGLSLIHIYISFVVSNVRNDVTGNWRIATIAENIEMQDYALDYYKEYFKSDDEIHAIVNFNYKTTTKISVMGNLLDVSVYEYVDKEEHDAKLLFSGMLLKEYHVNKDTGEIEEIQ